MTGVDFLKWVAAWLGLGSGIYVLFDRAEKVVRPEVREAISQWLQNRGHGEVVKNWPSAFARVFDRLFGEKHLSWKCFRRSCVASMAAVMTVALLLLSWEGGSTTYDVIATLGLKKQIVVALILAPAFLSANLLGDYLSLLESRYVVRLMGNAGSPGRVSGLLIVDLVATGAIWATMFAAGRQLLSLYLHYLISPGALIGWRAAAGMPLKIVAGTVGIGDLPVLWAISFYSTYFTSAWIWLYLLGGLALKALHLLGLGVKGLGKILDIKEQPLRSIGMVCNLGITAVFLVLLLYSLLFP